MQTPLSYLVVGDWHFREVVDSKGRRQGFCIGEDNEVGGIIDDDFYTDEIRVTVAISVKKKNVNKKKLKTNSSHSFKKKGLREKQKQNFGDRYIC